MKNATMATAFLTAFLAAPAISQAPQHDIEHLVVEMASTPQEHQAVAGHYRMRAQEARDEARRHQEMGRIYAARRGTTPQVGRQHCERLAQKYNEIATDFDALAELHDDLSENPAE
jgi:hypothetical protein